MPIITEILDDVFPLFTKSTSIRLQTLILNEFEKSELEKRNLYGFKEFKIIVSEVMNSPLLNINDKKISIIDRLEIIFKSGEIKNLPKEIDFLGKNGFDIFCYEVFCFFWWKLQFSEEDTYKPIVKYFEYNVSIINDLYINFWRFVCGHELFPNIRPLIEKYNLSALLDLYSVEDYFVDLYVNGFLLLNGEVKDLKYFYEQMYNIMHLIPFNRITRLSSNFGITPKKSLYPPTENMSFSFEIPLNIKSSLITLFHQLSMQLNFILINELMSKTDPYKSVKKMNEDEIHQLVEQIRQCSQLMDSISRLQRKVDTPYFLNKKVSLLTALSVLLYQFYEKENISYNLFLIRVKGLFERRGYTVHRIESSQTDQNKIKVGINIPKEDGEKKHIEILISMGTIRSSLNDFSDKLIKYNDLCYISTLKAESKDI